jgi:nucleoside 2-deoxyribosyltransferase
MNNLRAYLAGPDVFLLDALDVAKRKKDICAKFCFDGVFPLDSELDLEGLSLQEKGYRISAANERLIQTSDVVFANMTPFRGPSCDVGTAFEMGYARALGKPVFAYTNDAQSFVYRTKQALGGKYSDFSDGTARDHRDMLLEDFGLVDNLMLDGAVYASTGLPVEAHHAILWDRFTSLIAFEQCVKRAHEVMLGV